MIGGTSLLCNPADRPATLYVLENRWSRENHEIGGTMMPALVPSRQLLQPFEDQGYVILPGIIEPAVQAAVRREMEAIVDFLADHLMSQQRVIDPLKGEPFETRLYRLFQNHLDLAPKNLRFYLHRPGLYGLLFHALLLDIVEQLLGPEIRLYPNYSARPKLPEWAGTQVLWHQDAGYTSDDAGVAGLRMVNVWTPLVKATVANGCMQFIPGTHKLGAVRHEQGEHYLQIAAEFLEPRLSQAVNLDGYAPLHAARQACGSRQSHHVSLSIYRFRDGVPRRLTSR